MKNQVVVLFWLLSLSIPLALAQTRGGQPPPRRYHRLPLGPNAFGPESVAFDCEGRGPYVGISDGRILRWENPQVGWTEFAVTSPYRTGRCDGLNNSPMEQYCGRPLGLKFDSTTCELYIADSSFGLLRVGRHGGVAVPLTNSAEGVPFRFLNALDLDIEGGAVYFTDTSSYFNRWNFQRAMSTGDRSGRLMRYDLVTGSVTVLLRGLSFANGVALSRNKDFVLVTETMTSQVTRLWLTGPRAGVSEVFLHLYGHPDNINRNADGDFWIAQNPYPPIKVDEYGRVLEVLSGDEIVDSSDVIENRNTLWIGSVVQNYLVFTT